MDIMEYAREKDALKPPTVAKVLGMQVPGPDGPETVRDSIARARAVGVIWSVIASWIQQELGIKINKETLREAFAEQS